MACTMAASMAHAGFVTPNDKVQFSGNKLPNGQTHPSLTKRAKNPSGNLGAWETHVPNAAGKTNPVIKSE